MSETSRTVPTELQPDHVIALYTECMAQERHFNGLEAGYRRLASTWLLAGFAAIGFLMNLRDEDLLVPPPLMIAAVGVLTALGIGMLWGLDLHVYHRLLNANFAEGLMLEARHPWLPQTHFNMYHDALTVGFLNRVVRFYLLGVCVPLAVSLAFVIAHLESIGIPAQVAAGVAGCLVIAGVARFIWRRTNAREPAIGTFAFNAEETRRYVTEHARGLRHVAPTARSGGTGDA